MKPIEKSELDKMPADVKAALRNGDMTTYDVLKECADSINEQVDYLNETSETLADNEDERIAAEQARETAEQAREESVIKSISANKYESRVDIVLGRRDDSITASIPAASTSQAGVMSAADKTKLAGLPSDPVSLIEYGGAGQDGVELLINGGDQEVVIPYATESAGGVMSADDKEKLDSLTPSSAAYEELIPLQDISDKVHFIGHLESDASKTLRADDISGWSNNKNQNFDYQSSPFWLAQRSFLFFDANASGIYYKMKFNADWNSKTSKTCVAIGTSHCNDAFVDGNVAYIDDGTNGSKDVYVLDLLTNTATKVTLDIDDWQDSPTNKTCTQLCGVCDYNETQYLAVAYDAKQSDESATIQNPPTVTDQYLRVYVVNKSNGWIADTLFGNPDVDGSGVDVLLDNEGNDQRWEGIFVQGATYVDGFLYVATNRYRASESLYGGIAVWVIDLARKTLVDKIIFDGDALDPNGNALAANNATYGIGSKYTTGDFEPEGIDYIKENGVTYLYMGIGRYKGIAKLLKFRAPVVSLSK